MKIWATACLVLWALALGSGARAQQCYTPVKSWVTDYSLKASAPTARCTTQAQATCTVNHSSAATGNLNVLFTNTCTSLAWAPLRGIVRPTTVTVADVYVTPADCPPGGGILTDKFGRPSGAYSLPAGMKVGTEGAPLGVRRGVRDGVRVRWPPWAQVARECYQQH
jgi:hypothetical protein